MLLFRFAALDDVSHAITTRHGGVSPAPFASLNMGIRTADDEANVVENRARFCGALGVAPGDVVIGRLSHGSAVSVFRRASRSEWPWTIEPVGRGSALRDQMFHTDAVVSDVPGLHFMMTFADCVPILFADRAQRLVAAAHAGWRGTAAGIAGNVVRVMIEQFGSRPQDIVAGIGPSIGGCCYPVGRDVVDAFHMHGQTPTVSQNNDDLHLDLWESNARQIRELGVPAGSIEVAGICTACHVADYYSHRRENGATGRFALGIGLT